MIWFGLQAFIQILFLFSILYHAYNPGNKKPLAILFIFSVYFLLYELSAYYGAGKSTKYMNILTFINVFLLSFYSVVNIIQINNTLNN